MFVFTSIFYKLKSKIQDFFCAQRRISLSFNFEHKYVQKIHVGEHASIIHPPDRCGISGSQLNSTGVPWVGDNARPL